MDYFYAPFWILAIILLLIVFFIARYKKMYFVDIQVIIMTMALGFAADMVLCKELDFYYFVSQDHKGWYSLWACIIMNPSLAYIYVKFLPGQNKFLPLYIGIWAIALTLTELYIAVPYNIVEYAKWRIIPWSPFLYICVFFWEYVYYKWLNKNIQQVKHF